MFQFIKFMQISVIDSFLVFNVTFSNISAIWRPVLVLEEAGENHEQATGKFYHLQLQVKCTLFWNLQSRMQTHAILLKACMNC